MRKAFRLRPEESSHCLKRLAREGWEDCVWKWMSLEMYWKVLTSLSMPSRLARKMTSLSTVSVVMEEEGRGGGGGKWWWWWWWRRRRR